MLGMGLLISTFTETQQQAMFIAWFFVIIFMLMSGLFTPVEIMPHWAQVVTWFNPIAYFVKVIRMVLLKGSGWSNIQSYLLIMLAYAVVMNGIAIWNYRKTT
jgi:ABC-2 type transport system permease protein